MWEEQMRWKSYHYLIVSIGVHGLLCLMVAVSLWMTASKITSNTSMEVELTEVPVISKQPQEEKGGGGGGGTSSISSTRSESRPTLTPAPQTKKLFTSQAVTRDTENKTPSETASNIDGANRYGAASHTGQGGAGTGIQSGAGSGSGTGQGAGTGEGIGSGKGNGTGGGNTINWISRFVTRVEQNKTYPFQARKQGVTGVVRVRVVISQGGTLLENRIVSSSGDSRLDQAALEAVRASVPYSHEYGGRLSMTIPMRFYLN